MMKPRIEYAPKGSSAFTPIPAEHITALGDFKGYCLVQLSPQFIKANAGCQIRRPAKVVIVWPLQMPAATETTPEQLRAISPALAEAMDV